MRRITILLLVTMAATLVMASGVAWAATVYCRPGANYCIGTDDDDQIFGTSGVDKILPKEGDDEIRAYGGDDIVDIVRTNGDDGGSNTVYAHSGDDSLNGKIGNDYMYGGSGEDRIYGYSGNDRLYGGDDHDLISGGGFIDYLYGEGDNDALMGFEGDDYLIGGDGHDTLWGMSGNDRFVGDQGSDSMGLQGNEPGDDKIWARDGTLDYIYCGTGTDTVYSADLTDFVEATCENVSRF